MHESSNRDAGSYKLSYTWDQVISGSRAPSRCIHINSQQDVNKMSDGHRNVVIRSDQIRPKLKIKVDKPQPYKHIKH